MSLLDAIAAHIDTGSTLTVGTNLFKGLMPDEPIECACVYEYAGEPPRESMGNAPGQVERPRIQVVSRSVTYVGARDRAQTIWNILQQVTDASLSGVRYLRVQPMSSPFLMGRDENRNVKVVFNCVVEKEMG